MNPQVIPIEQVIARSCLTERNAQRGSFINSGNGGIPVAPGTPIDDFASDENFEPTAQDRSSMATTSSQNERPLVLPESESHPTTYISSVTPWKPGAPIIRANQLVRTDDGELIFVAEASTQTLESAKELVCY